MSPNTSFPPGSEPRNEVCERVMAHPRVTYHVTEESLVGAIQDELLVLRCARVGSDELQAALENEAVLVSTLGDAGGRGRKLDLGRTSSDEDLGAFDAEGFDADGELAVELWRLTSGGDSIDAATRLRDLADTTVIPSSTGVHLEYPAVSPNHICVVSPNLTWCPAGPPHSTPAPAHPIAENFIERPVRGAATARVVVIDTGYIYTHPAHEVLDERVVSVAGEWHDSTTGVWHQDPPDELDADGDGRLDGVAGHGTFIAGLIAHGCRQAKIISVGQRHEVIPIGNLADPADQERLFTTEYSLAQMMLKHCNADVIQCGFSFPTLQDFPSLPFAPVMQFLRSGNEPVPGVAVVSPAGNESSSQPYWPAAHPDVIGVAATNVLGTGRAYFSNWGDWADCCTRGEYVFSTYVHWLGPVQGEPLTDIEDFRGWARWDGTSFAAPKVSAAIAKVLTTVGGGITPTGAWNLLKAGQGGTFTKQVTAKMAGAAIDLTYLQLD